MRAVLARGCGVLLLATAACSNTVSSLSYTPPPSVLAVPAPRVATVESVDTRKEAPNRLATIMGGFGNPLKTLDTAKPVKDEVADAFLAGLRARNMLAGSTGPLRLVLTIRRFDADMIIGRTARMDLTAILSDRTGRTVFSRAVVDSASETKFFRTGVFAEIGDLRQLSQTVLDRTVDTVLDDPAFRAAIDRPGV